MSHEKVKVAVAQVSAVSFDTEKTLDKLEQFTQEAANQGAELILFPEAFVGTYPKGQSFGASMGNRTPEGREDFLRYWENAIEVPSKEIDRMGQIAAENNIYLVSGIIERDGGTLYCTVVFFDNEGNYMGKHRKLMPTATERLVWGYGDGSTMPVFDTPIGKMGAIICWENYMPLMRAAHYAKGIELYLAPTADGRETWLPTMRHIAMEGRCFVLTCNQFNHRQDYPEDFDNFYGDNPDTPMMTGGSCIIAPNGDVLAGPNYDSEGILTAEIDRADLARWKFDFDVVGHYARPDVFQLVVNEEENSPVVFKNTPENPKHKPNKPEAAKQSQAPSGKTSS